VKLLLKLDISEADDECSVRKLAQCVGELVSEKHRVIVVHDNHESWTPLNTESSCHSETAKTGAAESAAAVQANKLLISLFNTARVPAIGFCGFDGNLLQLKSSKGRSNGTADIAAVRTFWLDIVTGNGGVPVIANLGSALDGTWKKLDADQLAIRCAVAWKADLLMFLVAEDGVRNGDGAVMRWLDANDFDEIDKGALSARMLARLNLCFEALEGGVRRARIYPFSRIEDLADLYFTRLDYGTEVTAAVLQKRLPSWNWNHL
jgi:acetylglutamate kinase